MRKPYRKSSWNYYSIKLIYQMTVTSSPIPERIDEDYSDTHTFFEESIILVRAQSFDHAFKIAEQKAREINGAHINPYEQTVETRLIEAIDCYLIGDEITGGVEVYSSCTPVHKEMTANEYLMRKYDYSLENCEWNKQQREKYINLQKVIRFEDFSKWRKE